MHLAKRNGYFVESIKAERHEVLMKLIYSEIRLFRKLTF